MIEQMSDLGHAHCTSDHISFALLGSQLCHPSTHPPETRRKARAINGLPGYGAKSMVNITGSVS